MSEESGQNGGSNTSKDRPRLFDGPCLPGGDSGAAEHQQAEQRPIYSEDNDQPLEQNHPDKYSGEIEELECEHVVHGPPNYNENAKYQCPHSSALPLALPAPESFGSAPFPSSSTSTGENPTFRARFTGNNRHDNLDENEHHYVGLVNQAMTCYLNSLIQTLYMTPEFRNAIYNWKFNGNPAEETKNIPYQLQKLFLLLQTSDKHSLETKELTASFGWESNDAYDQHDVQELCRLMFDALEHRWKKTENRSLIQDLYKGTIEDYVKCLNCKTEKVKPDVFLDLPLAVKQFGATESYKSVEEAMIAFIKPEVLNGNNQYKCDTCNSKQDAEKGLRITHFPYLLTIQLKRFDFDYNTLHRIKLNDRMSFPDYIDVNDFVHNPASGQQCTSTSKLSYANAVSKKKTTPPPKSATIQEEEEKAEDITLGTKEYPSVQESSSSAIEETEAEKNTEICWLEASRDSDKVACLLSRGKYIYELISIMVHQGNASGGHYFAYIKNVDQNRWFCFNDSSVQAAHMNDIFRTFGGPSGWYLSNTNAYMLMYRQVDPSANKHFIRTVDLPFHLLSLKDKLVEDEKEKIRKQRFQEDHIKVHYLCNEALYLCVEPGSTLILKNTSLSSVFDQLISKFEQQFTDLGSDVPGEILDNSRLIMCDSNWMMKEHIEDLENKTLEDIVDCEYSSFIKPDVYLMLDTVPCEHDTYPFYRFPTSKHFKTYEVNVVDIKEETIKLFKRVCLDSSLTIAEVKEILGGTIKSYLIRSPTYGIDLKEDVELSLKTELLRMIIDKGHVEETSPLIVVDSDSQLIGTVEMPSYGKVQMYIDFGPSDLLAADRECKDIRESKMLKIIERKKFSTKLVIVLPTSADYRRAGMVPQSVDPVMVAAASSNEGQRMSTSATMPFPCSSAYDFISSSFPSTSTTYSSSSVPPTQVTSYSLQDPTPPPSYSLKATNCDLPNSDQGSPLSSNNNDEDDRMDDLSPSVSTPKRSPEVSEESGDEICGNTNNFAYHKYPGNNMDLVQSKLLRLVENSPECSHGSLRCEMPDCLDLRALSNNVDWRSNIGSYAHTDNDWMDGGLAADKPSDKDSACETLLGGESTSDSTPSTSIYTIGLVSVDTWKMEAPCIEVEVDRRQLCTHLKNWLAQHLNLEQSNFVIMKHFNVMDDGFPTNSDQETIREAYSHIDHLSVKLHVSTKSHEKAIMISKFDLDQPDQQKWTVLFHLPASEKTVVSELLEKSKDLLSRSYDLHYKLEQLRFRDLSENGAVALKRNSTMESRGQNQWHRNLYLQILKEEEVTENLEESVPVMIQRWCPCTLQVRPVFEIHLPLHSPAGESASRVLRTLLAKHADLPVERIQISDAFPNIGWMKWPYSKSVLELFDNVKFRGEGATTHLENSYNGKLVYYKDSIELKRDITEDERKSIRIKENVAGSLSSYNQSSNLARRKERPLRIQMSSVSESDP